MQPLGNVKLYMWPACVVLTMFLLVAWPFPPLLNRTPGPAPRALSAAMGGPRGCAHSPAPAASRRRLTGPPRALGVLARDVTGAEADLQGHFCLGWCKGHLLFVLKLPQKSSCRFPKL